MSSIIKSIYRIMISCQIIIFMVFVILNYDSLNRIYVEIDLETYITDITNVDFPDFNFYINLYIVVGLLIGFVCIAMLFSVNILDTGFNEVGSGLFATFSYYLSFYIILEVPLFYYMNYLGLFGFIIQLIVVLIWFFRGIELLHDKELD